MQFGKKKYKQVARKYSNYTNEALLFSYKEEQNAFAFLALFQRYNYRLWIFFHKEVNNGEDCNDLMQETYYSLLNSKAYQLNNILDYEKYLFGMAFNKRCQYHRQAKKNSYQNFDTLEANGIPLQQLTDTQESFHSWEQNPRDVKLNKLEAAINQLSPPQQQAVNLRLKGMNYKEIAKLMQTKPTNIGSLINRAKQVLKRLLDDKT